MARLIAKAVGPCTAPADAGVRDEREADDGAAASGCAGRRCGDPPKDVAPTRQVPARAPIYLICTPDSWFERANERIFFTLEPGIMSYDVVVIGAGAFGCSLAYHLGRAGQRVALMDRVGVASQTSPRAAGLFKHVQSTATRTALAALSARTSSTSSGKPGYRCRLSARGA